MSSSLCTCTYVSGGWKKREGLQGVLGYRVHSSYICTPYSHYSVSVCIRRYSVVTDST